jgi:hypothetical protein
MNYQGTGATQWIVGLPLMFLPALTFLVLILINTEVAIITIAAIGIIGLLMRNSLLNKIAAVTLKENTRPLTVSNNKKISNDNFRVVTT